MRLVFLAFVGATQLLSGCTVQPEKVPATVVTSKTSEAEPVTVKDSAMPKDTPVLLTHLDQMPEAFSYWQRTKGELPKKIYDINQAFSFGCVEFNYTITAEGKTEDIAVVKSYPDIRPDNDIAEALSQWRWQPTDTNHTRQPVRTVNFIVTNFDHPEFDEHCGKYMPVKPRPM